MVKIKITEEENNKLQELYKTAQTTPVIAPSVQAGLEGRDLATLAWNDVRDYMDALAKKYNYDPTKYAVDPKTGEVVEYSQNA